jgi:RNA polymerase sigma factor (sigma-70 family)
VNSLTDQQLLRDYTESRSETAFAELVRRHVDLVYSAALRMVRDAHLAEDVTQGVFVAFAQNARELTDRPVLSGWLHRTTQNLAANAVRSDVRRRAREQEAAAMNELLATQSEAVWEQIAPHLDAALRELSEPDRDALLLRYFERKSARDMALMLGTSEDAAQKRVSRAVERLREFFAKRGVAVSASGLVVAISANAIQAAPVGLAVTISTATALAGATLATTATITAAKAIAMTTLQKTLITAVIATAAVMGIYEARQASILRTQVQTLQQQTLPAGQIQQLMRDRDESVRQLVALREDNERLNRNTAELRKLRGEVGVLRQQKRELERGATKEKSGLSAAPAPQESHPAPFQLHLVVDDADENAQSMTNNITASDGKTAPETLYVQKSPVMDYTAISSASVATDPLGAPLIEILFTDQGREQFAKITKENINKRIAIAIDGQLYSAPVVKAEITGGKAQVSGSFTLEQAQELAAKINDALESR